jgi:glycosyltransferase involved in cell wall biosynthesis
MCLCGWSPVFIHLKFVVMSSQDFEIGYILKGYPRTSETFVTNEIFLLENEGLNLSIFSLKKLEGQKLHGVVSKIKAHVTYLPETTPSEEDNLAGWLWKNAPKFAASHWKLFLSKPMTYLRALLEAMAMSMRYRAGVFAAPNRAFIKEFMQAGFIALKVLESGRIRHLHAHFCHTATTVAMLASRMSRVPFSFTAHAKDIYRRDMNPGDLLRVKMRRARFIVTCTKANRDYLKSLCPEERPLHTIYHGLDPSMFAPSNERTKIEEERRGRPVLLSAGRMVEKKGFPYLVEACRQLKDRGYEFNCLIIGGGDPQYTEEIRGLIERLNLESDVILQQAVTQEELRRIYQLATLFALPCQIIESGDRDGIPNVLVEAMAMEMPVISTGISGIPELIKHRENGLLVPQRDAAALAEAIGELLDNPGLRHKLGRAARVTICRNFDARQNIRALSNLFPASLMPGAKSSVEEQKDDVVAYSRDRF